MKSFIFSLITLTLTFSSYAAVVTSTDNEKQCTIYQAVRENENGQVVIQDGQRLLSKKHVYGLSFSELEIDFDRREVRVQTMMNVVLGLNLMLVPRKSIIREDNPEFTFLVNQINRKLALFEKICVNADNEVVYAKYFPTEE